MKLLTRVLIGACLITGWHGGIAQQLLSSESMSFRHLNSRQGLSQNCVTAVEQDQDGFMWFGTLNGLNRYDGYQMQVFSAGEDSLRELPDDLIQAIYRDDPSRSMWIGTPSGLSSFNLSTERFTHYSPKNERNGRVSDIRTVIRDSRGRIWTGGNEGIFYFDSTLQAFTQFPSPEGIWEGFDVHDLYETTAGELWIGTERGLYILEADSGNRLSYRTPDQNPFLKELEGSPIRLIEEDETGAMWIGIYQQGLVTASPDGEFIRIRSDGPPDHSLSDDDVRALTIGPEGKIWIGCFSGLNILDPATGMIQTYKQLPGEERSLGGGSVRSVFFDSRGSAWIGTYYDGVSYFNSEAYRFTHHFPVLGGMGLNHPVVSSFWEDEEKNLWIGTEGGGITFWNRSENEFQHFDGTATNGNGLSGQNVKSLLGTGDSLWIGTWASGLNLLNLRTGQWKVFHQSDAEGEGLTSENVYHILSRKGQLWISTFGGGVNVLDLSTGKWKYFLNQPGDSTSLIDNRTRSLLIDSDEQIWVGTSAGVSRAKLAENSLVFTTFLHGYTICSLTESRDQLIWAGTLDQGVIVMDTKGTIVRRFSEEEGLPGNTVFGLLEDEKGTIWLSTDKGLAKIDRRDHSVIAYHPSDDLYNLEYNFDAAFQCASGEILFGGKTGFTSFYPSQIRTNTFVPPLVFTSLTVGGERVYPGDDHDLLETTINETEELVFPYNAANFSIGFSALDYLNPVNNQYQYKLEGLESQWRHVQGQAEASYILQRSGDYLFRVKGGNTDGIWNNKERLIRITVLPPPWRTSWAYSIYACLAILFLGAGYWGLRIRHRLQIEKLTKSQQEELYQAKLRFYTNVTHEFRTPLTLILGPVEELLKKAEGTEGERKLTAVRQNTKRLLRLVNQLLNFRSLETDHIEMEVASGNIVKFLREICLSFQEQARMSGIQFQFIAEEDEIELWYDRDKLEKVFYNLLSNAFKFTPSDGRIEFKVVQEEDQVRIRVTDTGPGIPGELKNKIFERYFKHDQEASSLQEGTGIGLSLSRQLVQMHGGEIRLVDGARSGASLEVLLPAGNNHFDPDVLATDFQDSEAFSGYEQKAKAEPELEEIVLFGEQGLQKQAQTILIVEDNHEVREYIAGIFNPHFRLLLAKNGKEGLPSAIANSPDLIISDVMMPEMDGITLCSKLKTTLETSHIPVILLTARTGQIFRVEGLETGADAYLTKPFSPYELQLKVRNLIESRKKIRERFHSVLTLEPKEITLTSKDEDFLTRALAIVETNIDNPEFTAETFAYEIGVSRAMLFTKLKGIAAQTPNNFVKNIRLKRSVQLLEKSDLGVAEIAYQVGFRDARYFSKCFQKEYGRTPSSYREESIGQVADS